MLKVRAQKTKPVTDQMWLVVDSKYRSLVGEFLREHRTEQTRKQYSSALRQFGWYIHEHLGDKKYWKITKREANGYINYLLDLNMSSSIVNMKKSAISSLNNYIETFVADDDEDFSTFRNFMRGLKPVDKTTTSDKGNILKNEEYARVSKELRDRGLLLEVAWLSIAFYTGCRRNEIRQLKSEILDYNIKDGMNYITSHAIRGKGKGQTGKTLYVDIPLIALDDVRNYIESRGFVDEYIFSYIGKMREVILIYESWANDFCNKILSPILGRKITPHILRHSCITNMLERGVNMEMVSKHVAHHENITTTQLYDHRDDSEEKNSIYDYKIT